jgi:hypothetical protein
MHMPRILIVLSIAVLALAGTAAASAAVAEREPTGVGSQLSLAGGKGMAVVTSQDGSILGTIKQGSITFTDYPRGLKTEFDARKWGCEKRKKLNKKTTVCSGTDLWFSIAGGAWMAALRGRGIAASAVVEGKVLLRGTKGTFSIDGGTRRKWPLKGKTYQLG